MADYPGLTYPETPAAEAETLSLMAFYIQDGFVWLGVLYFSLHYCCSKTASNRPEFNYNSNVNGNSPTRDSSGRRRRLDSINDDDDGDDNGGDRDAAGDGNADTDADAADDDTLLTMAAPSDDSSMVGANSRRWCAAGGGGRIAWMDTLRVFLAFSIVTYNICCV